MSSTEADCLKAHQHCYSHHGGEKVRLKAHPAQIGGHLQRSKFAELCGASPDAEIGVQSAAGVHSDQGAHRQMQARNPIDRRVCISTPAAGHSCTWAEGMHRLVMMMMLGLLECAGRMQSPFLHKPSPFPHDKPSSRQASWGRCTRVQGLTRDRRPPGHAQVARQAWPQSTNGGFVALSAFPGVHLVSCSPLNTQDSRAHIKHAAFASCRCSWDSSSANNTYDCRAHVAPSLMWSPCQTTWCGHHLIRSISLLRW